MGAPSDFFADDEFSDVWERGRPGISVVANAIQFWAVQQQEDPNGRQPTIRDAALAFRMTDADVRAAVEHHYWMFVTGPDDDPTMQFIEHEGE
jgi:hypothetical protein